VRIYLSSLKQQSAGLFDLSLQGQTVAKGIGFNTATDAGVNRVVVKEFNKIPVDQTLKVELTHHDDQHPGAISAIELIRE
jgi:hypothetical protein